MPTTYQGLVEQIIDFINILIPALIGIVFVYFIWKIIDAWVINAGDETKRTEGRKYVVAAVIALVLMISTWGIVAMIGVSFF